MCGLAGYVDYRGDGPIRTDILDAMSASLLHRGPDATGTWHEGPCGLAHRRLSIIDVEGSPQPMESPSDNVAIAYNGELYNYESLRRELVSLGHGFRTEGDTEVILKGAAQWWTDAATQFDGMFAFAAWDSRRHRLLLARDPLGVKPLFYANPAPGLIVFGSEAKAVLMHPDVETTLDLSSLRQACRFRAVYGRDTLYETVKQVEPGQCIEFSSRGLDSTRYYTLAEQCNLGRAMSTGCGEKELIQSGLGLLRAAVRKRLIADVPVGSFLSGGVDSSLVAALMVEAREDSSETRTYSVGFADDPHSELKYAKQVADSLKTTHTVVSLSPSDYMDSLPRLTGIRDSPLSEPADPAIARMSSVARRDVKVVLGGEGADEVFCGYPKYGFADPSWTLRMGLRLLTPRGAAFLAGVVGLDKRKVRTLVRALAPPDELQRIVQWFSELDRAVLSELLPGIGWSDANWQATSVNQSKVHAEFATESPILRMQAIDCGTWLPGNLLERGDRMTMATGLEARVPFLDKELVAFGLGLEQSLKVRGRERKWILQQWARQLLPANISRRPKWGFHVPLELWFRGIMRGMLHDYLTNPHGLCATYGNGLGIRSLLKSHADGKVDASRALWSLLSMEIWYQDVYRRRLSS